SFRGPVVDGRVQGNDRLAWKGSLMRGDTEEKRSRLARVLAHPLTITFAGAVLAAIVLPLVTREWQDRQNELDLKRSLVERVAEASTTAVRKDIFYVEA